MNRFRIVDTRFRILKGGKIGLAMSVAMIGGMLTLSSTSVYATDYFGSNTSVVTTYNDADWVQGSQYSAVTVASQVRLSTDASDNVVFKPYGVTSTYVGVDDVDQGSYVAGILGVDGNGDGLSSTSYDSHFNYYLTTVDYTANGDGPSDINAYYATANGTYGGATVSGINSGEASTNTLTFASGANAKDIYKSSAINYITTDSATYDALNDIATYTYGAYDTLSTAYIANLIFNGSNNISGYTDIGDGNIRINGGATFAGTVNAGSVNIGTSSLVTFNSLLDLNNAGGTNKLTFDSAGNVILNAGLDGSLDFNGKNATVTLSNGNITGDIDTTNSKSGTLVFGGTSTVGGSIGGTAALKEIILNGTGTVQVHDTNVANVNFNAATTLNILSGTFNTTADTSSHTDFNNYAGTINIYDDVTVNSNILSTNGSNGVTASVSNTVSFLADATMNGNIGTADSRIADVKVGSSPDANSNTVTMNGHIYATQVKFSDNDMLSMSSGKNITGTVVTNVNGEGILALVGGTQTVTGTVGASGASLAQVDSGANSAISTFTDDVFAVTAQNTGTGISNFNTNVTTTNINVLAGTSNFTDNVTAVTTTISTGEGNFNTNDTTGVTDTNIIFTGAGTANLYNGLTDGVIGNGTIAFAGHNAIVNIWDVETIAGAISTATTNNTGIVNYKGDGTISSTVGTTNLGIKELNINTANEQNTTTGVLASGDIFAGAINLKNNGTLTLADNVNIKDTDTSSAGVATLTTNTGTLTMLGTSTIDGVVGASDKMIGTVNAGANSATSTMEGMVYATTLNYLGDGIVTLNGKNGATGGMVGTVDFGTGGAGTLKIGNNVNLTTGSTGIQFANANNATLTFDGNSTVNGFIGGDSLGRSTFSTIEAGVNNSTVTFKNNIYDGNDITTTLDVTGTGTVNLEGNFDGYLQYKADGTVNVSDGKSILSYAVHTDANNTGTLNFLGSTTVAQDIGTSNRMLKAVNFNTEINNVTETINKNIYADNTTIGHANVEGDTATYLADVTGVYDYAGATAMKEWRGQTAANITADMTFGGNLTIADTTSAINFGKSHVNVGGNITSNGGAMSFTVNTQDIDSSYTGTGTATSAGSGQVNSTTGTLTMSGAENVQVNYVGSLANSGNYTVVSTTSGTTENGTVNTVVSGAYNQNEKGNASDNSFAIDTRVATNAAGDLIVYADRTGAASGTAYSANQNYVYKSGTLGDLSNNAATVLGGIAAAGNQTGDMVQVIQKMDIDSFGFGNNQQNLETQVKRLAPIVNASLSQSAIGANTLTLNTVSNRIADLRGDSVILPRAGVTGMSAGDETAAVKGVWAKVIAATTTQEKDGMYDGYKTRSAGLAMGIDREFTSKKIVAGLAFGYTNTDIDQQDFRSGDTADTDSFNLVAYASKNFEKAYVEGALSYAKHNTDSTRATAVGRTATADIDADQYTAHISGGYRFNIKDSATVTPFLTLDYTHLAQDGYTETGADAINLKVDEMSTNRTTVGGGLRVGTTVEKGSAVLRPELKLAAYHISGGSNTDIIAQYVGGGEKFVTPGTDLSSMMYNVGLGLKAETSKSTSLGVSIDYDRSSDGLFEGYTGQLVARYEF